MKQTIWILSTLWPINQKMFYLIKFDFAMGGGVTKSYLTPGSRYLSYATGRAPSPTKPLPSYCIRGSYSQSGSRILFRSQRSPQNASNLSPKQPASTLMKASLKQIERKRRFSPLSQRLGENTKHE